MNCLRFCTVFIVLASVFCENCDRLGILLYEDLGCTPEKSELCPIRYSCAGLEPSDKCHFRGKDYSVGETVDIKLTNPLCNGACSCTKQAEKAKFTCSVADCDEWLGPPIGPECYRTYSLNECCSTGRECPPFQNKTCVVDGTDYNIGQRFYPKNTCLSCVCQEGFNGNFDEPFCVRKKCGVQLRESSSENLRKKCAPLYGNESDGALCCPDGWVCADGTEEIKGDVERDEECTFGEKTLKIGQRFEKIDVKSSYGRKFDKVKCQCVIPPLLTCNEE